MDTRLSLLQNWGIYHYQKSTIVSNRWRVVSFGGLGYWLMVNSCWFLVSGLSSRKSYIVPCKLVIGFGFRFLFIVYCLLFVSVFRLFQVPRYGFQIWSIL